MLGTSGARVQGSSHLTGELDTHARHEWTRRGKEPVGRGEPKVDAHCKDSGRFWLGDHLLPTIGGEGEGQGGGEGEGEGEGWGEGENEGEGEGGDEGSHLVPPIGRWE